MSGSDDRWRRDDEQKAGVGARAPTGQVRREAVVGGAREGDGEECVRGSTCEEIKTGPGGSRGSRHHESSAFTTHHGTLQPKSLSTRSHFR
jgi:hypothetical protein